MNDGTIGPSRAATTARRRLRASALLLCALSICAGLGWVAVYNVLVGLEEHAAAQWRQVENQLDRRNALVPAITELAAAAALHERGVLTQLAELRTPGPEGRRSSTPAEALQDDRSFARAWGVIESAPVARTAPLFLDVQAQLAGTEARIATERRRYNAAARAFNTRLRTLPYRLFAVGFDPIPYYEGDRSRSRHAGNGT